MSPTQLKNQHLLWRAGFGPMAEQVPILGTVSPDKVLQSLIQASKKAPETVSVADSAFDGLVNGIGGIVKQDRQLSEDDRKRIREKSREDLKSLNILWLNEFINSKQQLREKMSFFWHGHFASRNINILYQQQLLHVIRTNALGSFRTLLQEVSKSASIINFLNNNQNRKGHPNENFAREVMELFTSGRGTYTEKDVAEAARAFTGWGASLSGEFVFRRFQHDDGPKEVFGKRGNFTGDDILEMLLEKRETASLMTRKIYKFLVNDHPDEHLVHELSRGFYESDYDISKLVVKILSSDWFYEPKNIGSRIKSPVELIAGIRRMIPMDIENEESLLLLQRLMGQLLFYPPGVAGWPGGTNWIDSSSLLLRLRIPGILTNEDLIGFDSKPDDDQAMGRSDLKAGKNLVVKSSVNWKLLEKNLRSQGEINYKSIQDVLLQSSAEHRRQPLSDVELPAAVTQIMSTPDYQLC